MKSQVRLEIGRGVYACSRYPLARKPRPTGSSSATTLHSPPLCGSAPTTGIGSSPPETSRITTHIQVICSALTSLRSTGPGTLMKSSPYHSFSACRTQSHCLPRAAGRTGDWDRIISPQRTETRKNTAMAFPKQSCYARYQHRHNPNRAAQGEPNCSDGTELAL